jgi:hypothetical protein
MSFFDTLVIVCYHFVVPCRHSDLFVIPHFSSSMLFVNNIFLHSNHNTQQNVSLLDYCHSTLLEIPHIHGIQILCVKLHVVNSYLGKTSYTNANYFYPKIRKHVVNAHTSSYTHQYVYTFPHPCTNDSIIYYSKIIIIKYCCVISIT